MKKVMEENELYNSVFLPQKPPRVALVIHLQSFNLEKSQLHVFLSSESSQAIEVPYPKKVNHL